MVLMVPWDGKERTVTVRLLPFCQVLQVLHRWHPVDNWIGLWTTINEFHEEMKETHNETKPIQNGYPPGINNHQGINQQLKL